MAHPALSESGVMETRPASVGNEQVEAPLFCKGKAETAERATEVRIAKLENNIFK